MTEQLPAPTSEQTELLNRIPTLLEEIRSANELRARLASERDHLVRAVNDTGISIRRLAELLDVPLGTAATWLREARREKP
jgi:DNA-directed RNA polymerase specialized sigma24 family protein